MKQQVSRKTLTGDWKAFAFPYKARRFFVKNYGENPIYVSFESGTAESASFKIMAGVGEEVAISYHGGYGEIGAAYKVSDFYTDTVYVKGTGEVEVQEVDFVN